MNKTWQIRSEHLLAVFHHDLLELLQFGKVHESGLVDACVSGVHLGDLVAPEVADGQCVVVLQREGRTLPSDASAAPELQFG